MDVYPEFKWNKRIKLEHSYAKESDQVCVAAEEDPLRIYPEDLDGIKKETEDEETIIIKSEPDDNAGACRNDKCDDRHAEKTLMEVVGSEPCESAESAFFLANLGLVNCEVEANINNSESSRPPDSVPKQVFQEMQKMYEKAMADVRSLETKLANEKQKKINQSSKNANNSKTLKNDIKRLKYQLTVSKNKEDVLKRTLDSRGQADMEGKKTLASLRTQVEELLKNNRECNVCITELKQMLDRKEETIKLLRLSLRQHSKTNQKRKIADENIKKLKDLCVLKESQRKDLETKCSMLTQSLAGSNAKLEVQQKELEKLKLDIDIMDRSIIDSLKTRQSLRDQLKLIEKDFREVKENPYLKMKLQETQKALTVANIHVEDLEKRLEAERKVMSYLVKEKQTIIRDHALAIRAAEVQRNVLRTTVEELKKTAKQKGEELRKVQAECFNLREVLERRKQELIQTRAEMQEQIDKAKAKQCEYCGF